MGYILGANVTNPTTDPDEGKAFGLGDILTTHDGKEFVYVQANGAITGAGYAVTIDETYQAAMITATNAELGDLVGIASAAFLDNDYGWVQRKGVCVIRVAASAAANVVLAATATAGQLDDAVGDTIVGAVLTTANGGAAATAAGVLNYPVVGATTT